MMRKRVMCALAGMMVVSALFVCGCPHGPETVVLRGIVYDSSTALLHTPLPDAKVVLLGTTFEATTDTHGRYVIEDLPVGWYQFEVSASGYQTLTSWHDIQFEDVINGYQSCTIEHHLVLSPF